MCVLSGPEGKIQVSTDGGDFPVWSRTSNELFFMTADNYVHSVTLQGRNVGAPLQHRKLFQACTGTGLPNRPLTNAPHSQPYDVAPDGRFLFNCLSEAPGRFVVWINWHAARSESAR
jgi:hypothetical protein